MLIYHPAFDAYHCVFRMLVISGAVSSLELAKLRILDYYLCFPAEVATIQLPTDHAEIRKTARAAKNEYRGPVSAHRTFRDMEPIQHAAARMLAASGVFDSRQLELGIVSRTNKVLPADLLTFQALEPDTYSPTAALSNYVLHKLSSLPLAGVGGLKQRTGLMEHRYDAV